MDRADEQAVSGDLADDLPKPAPHPRGRPVEEKPARWKSIVGRAGKVLLTLLSVISLAATGYAYATYESLQSDMQTTDALDQSDDEQAPPADDGAQDILLVGADARTDMQGHPLPLKLLKTLRTEQTDGVNTDTLILLRVPKTDGKPVAISIPRDTWVDVPQGGQAKINSAFGVAKAAAAGRLREDGKTDSAGIERDSDQEGRKALVKTVQDLTQIRIDHYAEVSLLGFYLITEALGGVRVCLNHATEDKDSGADFKAGPQVVSGGEALSFVRQRKNLPRGDLDRIVRQQAFLASALHQVLSADTLADPSKMSTLTDAVHRSFVLDPGFDLLQFAEQAKGLASGDIQFATIPVITIDGRSPDGQSIVQIDPVVVQQFVAGLAGRGSVPASPTTGGGGSTGGGAAPVDQVATDGVTCVN